MNGFGALRLPLLMTHLYYTGSASRTISPSERRVAERVHRNQRRRHECRRHQKR